MYPKFYLYKRIKDAKILMDRNYDQDIDLNYLSQKTYLSKYHFIRLFKEAYGVSPKKYLSRKRIEMAKKMLSSDKSIGEICHAVGFKSIQSFSNLFKRETGLSPTGFRKQKR